MASTNTPKIHMVKIMEIDEENEFLNISPSPPPRLITHNPDYRLVQQKLVRLSIPRRKVTFFAEFWVKFQNNFDQST